MFSNPDPTPAQLIAALRRAHEVALQAQGRGHHPFGALLLAPDHAAVLEEQGNLDTVNHAESTLVRQVASRYDPAFLWNCTLVTTIEPCAMCAATAYWAHIGRIAYGASEASLRALTGDNPANPTLDLPCRELFARGRKPVRIFGPMPELADDLLVPHRHFWRR